MTAKDTPAAPPPDENQIIAERRAKLERLRAEGWAWPAGFLRDTMAARLDEAHGETDAAALEAAAVRASVGGRLMAKRVMGKASFGVLQDSSGRIQIYVSDDATGKDAHAAYKHWDVGDIVGVTGTLFRTRTGELTVRAERLELLAKSLRPLPEKWHGLTDPETRHRQRYVDLFMNEQTRWTFAVRARAVWAMREMLQSMAYVEVETPMLQAIPGGAAARPFVTHHHALGVDLYLRIAPELYLKRLIVGGYEKVFELNRNFRNEGISTRHNPEFTMLEAYCTFTGHFYMMSLVENLVRQAAQAALGTQRLTYQGRPLDLSKPFARLSMTEAIQRNAPEHWSAAQLRDRDFLAAKLIERGVAVKDDQGWGALQTMLFEHVAEKALVEPTFVINFPAEVSPLARSYDADPEIAERFELFIDGKEIANGFSELNDPELQAARFREQARRKEAGEHEAMHFDADYIRALEYGMPPTSGCGIGVDRLVMILTDSASIRDVILFPHMRPEA